MTESQRGKDYLHDKISKEKGIELSKKIDKDIINEKYNLIDNSKKSKRESSLNIITQQQQQLNTKEDVLDD